MADEQIPTDSQLRIAMFKAIQQIYLHSEANTKLLLKIDARVAGAESIASVVDDNEADVQTARLVAAQREIISHLYEKSHQYVAVIIAGAFAAYFATLSVLSARFSDSELRLSALLMTVSLTVFVMWEIINISYIGYHTMKGDFGIITDQPRWLQIGWPAAMFFSLATALPAIALSISVYLRGLGAFDWIAGLL